MLLNAVLKRSFYVCIIGCFQVLIPQDKVKTKLSFLIVFIKRLMMYVFTGTSTNDGGSFGSMKLQGQNQAMKCVKIVDDKFHWSDTALEVPVLDISLQIYSSCRRYAYILR